MDTDRKLLRVCTALILGALLFRLLGTLWPGSIDRKSDIASLFLFLQTGRVVRKVDVDNLPQEQPTVVPPPTVPPAQVCFTGEDAALLTLYDYADQDPDLEALLLQPMSWELTEDTPAVLIYHTHASESYENTEGYKEDSGYRTLDEAYNMLSVGAHMKALLEESGIAVLQDRTVHDYPSYNGSYSSSYASARRLLQENPGICLVLDIHRDAATDNAGNQVKHTVMTSRGEAAKIMLVVGAGNENWQENMALAVKLQVQLEKLCPGICRPICLRSSGFNQALSPGALLIEMGSAGNTRQEALLAAEYVSEAIISLKAGSTS